MDPLLQFLLALAIIILVAKLSGYLSTRLGQPAVLGELLAGLVLGPTVLNMLHWPLFGDPHLEESISHLAHIGVLFLMFVAGLEVDLASMRNAGRLATLAGVLGVLTPVGLGFAMALPFGYSWQEALFMGLVLAATSVSISAQTLMELGVLRSRVGIALLSAAVVDDILVILFLSLFTALIGDGGGGAITALIVLAKMLAFLAIAIVLGFRFIPALISRVDRLPISEGVMALVIVVIFLASWGAEALGGMAAITGAFLAGLMFGRTRFHGQIESAMHKISYSWLVPIFFVSIGLEADARQLGLNGVPFALALILVAVFSKVVGSGIGARLAGFNGRDSLRLGVGMTSRGEVGLIVASVGLSTGLVTDAIFASVVLMVLVTTLITPIMLKLLYPKKELDGTSTPPPA
jgi:Kef-type K+ transport system membrane component KefB